MNKTGKGPRNNRKDGKKRKSRSPKSSKSRGGRQRRGGKRQGGKRKTGEEQSSFVEVTIRGSHAMEGSTEVVDYGYVDEEDDLTDPTEASIESYFTSPQSPDPFGFDLYLHMDSTWQPEKEPSLYQLAKVRWGIPSRINMFHGESVVLLPGDRVVIETEKGQFIGEVVSNFRRISGELPKEAVSYRILRKATPKDLHSWEQHRQLAAQGLAYAREKARELGLNMKFFDAEVLHTGDKLMLYFIAPQRVDFRRLVRLLASRFSMRIELRQMGVRDEAKTIGGLGPCGQILCCTRYLDKFDSVSIRMAKAQNMVLNTHKLSGLCGRLKCCLAFEMEVYDRLRKEMPRVGSKVTTPRGEGRVVNVHLLKNEIKVDLGEGEDAMFRLEDISKRRRQQTRRNASHDRTDDRDSTGDGTDG